jgi:hypothetical protein
MGTGALAYTLGMRHAFDADHIAAIDNTTRKLVGEGKRPLSVGFFFSLGHSSVVFALAVLLNFGIRDLGAQLRNGHSNLQQATSIIGTCVSGFFLFLIAAFNIVILAGILRLFREMRSGALTLLVMALPAHARKPQTFVSGVRERDRSTRPSCLRAQGKAVLACCGTVALPQQMGRSRAAGARRPWSWCDATGSSLWGAMPSRHEPSRGAR